MPSSEQLRNYALIGLKYGLGYDQRYGDNARPLYIECYQTEDPYDFLPLLAEEAYKLGAPTVVPIYRNPGLERAQLLGEIALVGLDAPLSRFVKPHLCVMLDENKRCHMAFGNAYAAALEGGASMSEEALAALGCNKSPTNVHHDMMISDETMSVFAIDAGGFRVQLMEGGHWLPPFDCRA